MNLLLDKLPDHLLIDGQEFPIKTNFRDWIKFERILLRNAPEMDRLNFLSDLFLDAIPRNMDALVGELVTFYQCGEKKKKAGAGKKTKQLYDYEVDQYLIYTSFLQFYQIDLNQIEYMHWWQFRQLFLELPDDSKMKKVMMYRSMTIDSKMSSEQKRYYAEMKRLYALPDNRTEEQKAVSFGAILAGGMKIGK